MVTATNPQLEIDTQESNGLEDLDYDLLLAHPAIFLDTLGIIHDPNNPAAGGFRWKLWPWQWELLDHFTNNRRVIILKARQLGVSWLFAGYALYTFLSRPGSVILLISRREQEASKLLAKVTYMYHRLPPDLLPPSHRKDADTGVRFFSHHLHSEILALPATPDTGRSETSTLVIPDEWAIQEYAGEMYGGYEPTVGQNGQIIGGSTAKGPGGFFYDLWQGAKTAENGFLPIFLPWYLRPGRTVGWREQKKLEYTKAGTPELLGQEYPEDELDAFASSQVSVFPADLIRYHLAQIQRPKESRLDPDGNEWWRIYKEPRYTGRYILGADVAEGTGKDFSTGFVMDTQTGEHVSSIRLRISPDLFAQRLAEVGMYYNKAKIAVEKNSFGVNTIGTLHNSLGYDNLYYRPNSNPKYKFTQEDIGWITNQRTKPDMIINLRQGLSDGSITTYDSWFINEMPYYQKNETLTLTTYNAAQGFNDDMIIAGGIANMCRGSVRLGTRSRRSYKNKSLSR